jgi:hypothetical protein
MTIRRMISRDPAEFRAFQSRMTTVGKIRLGIYATPEGRRGRPEKIDTFRFTADNEALIRVVAEEYGGTAEQWTPQGAKTAQWQVITDAKAVEVYIVNGQNIDPVYEAWAGGRTCVRRCDGEWEQIKQDSCLCNGPARPRDPRELCKITIRVQVMLRRIQGLGSWLLESHGENAAMELSIFREFIAAAPMPVPAMLRLREETRRQWNPNPDKGEPRFETKNFFVPWFDISRITAEQIAIGGDALTQALSAAGAPAAIGGASQYAIEARPVSAPVVPVVPTPVTERPEVTDELRAKILADIEAQTTVEDLDALRDKLIARGINDIQIREAWSSKLAAVRAADDLTPPPRPYRVLVTGSRTWTDAKKLNEALNLANITHRGRVVLVHGACPQGADALADTWAEVNGVPVERYSADWGGPDGKGAGFARNQAMVDTRPDVVLAFIRNGSKGATHCAGAAENAGLKVLRFTDDTPVEVAPPERQPVGMPLREYRVGDTVTVGGIEFTKIGDNPFPSGSDATAILDRVNDQFVADLDAAISGPAITLPDVPDDDYDADELYAMLMNGASRQTPPLTTSELNALITRACGAEHLGQVDGRSLARLRAGLKAGTVSWR